MLDVIDFMKERKKERQKKRRKDGRKEGRMEGRRERGTKKRGGCYCSPFGHWLGQGVVFQFSYFPA